jgi:hypothetical protein
MNLLKAALILMRDVHKGEKLNYVGGSYCSHPRDVARRMHTIDEKVVACLHDAVESLMKDRYPKKDLPPAQEEVAIGKILDEIKGYFKSHGFDISRLLPELDVLTKRWSDKADYQGYIKRIICHTQETGSFIAIRVKRADLESNRDPHRNLPLDRQTPEDRARLRRYDAAIELIDTTYPVVKYRKDRIGDPIMLVSGSLQARTRSSMPYLAITLDVA